MSDGIIPYEKLSNEQIVDILTNYLVAVSTRGGRDLLIEELERLSKWLHEHSVVYESMNGGRQL